MTVPSPWTDYNNEVRVAILEINGVAAPKGKLNKLTGEYQRSTQPPGAPWNRVLNWDRAEVVLAPGDFAVFRVQYRLGNGTTFSITLKS